MKNVLLIIATFLLSVVAHAQKYTIIEGSLPSMKGQTKINLIIDYSELRIDERSIEDWLSYRQAVQTEYNAKDELEKELKPALEGNLRNNINERLDKVKTYLSLDGSAVYSLKVTPKNVDMKGNNINVCSILDNSGKVLFAFQIKGKGGTFGSMGNLWGDGYKDVGKKIGSILLKCF